MNRTIAIILALIGVIIIIGITVAVITMQNTANSGNKEPADSNPSLSEGKTYSISIQNFAFLPSTMTILKGDTVIWTNMDSASHTIISDSGNEISSENIATSASFSHKFNTPGTYNYHCGIHPSMKAKIIVQ